MATSYPLFLNNQLRIGYYLSGTLSAHFTQKAVERFKFCFKPCCKYARIIIS